MLRSIALAAVLVSGCSTVEHTIDRMTTRTPEEEATRRYNLCMKQTMGPFSGFSSPEARRKAAETCQGAMKPAE